MVRILFPVLSGTYEQMQYGLANELEGISNGSIEPCMLWMTQVFRTEEVSYPEWKLQGLLDELVVPPVFADACYRSLRYGAISLMDVIRINMIDTPGLSVERLLRWAIRYLFVCEHFLSEEGIDGVVLLLGRGLFQRCLGFMARSMGISTFYLCDAFIPGKTVHLWMSESEVTDDLKGIPLPLLSSEEKQKLDGFVVEQTRVVNIAASPYDASGFLKKTRSFFILLFTNSGLVGNRTWLDFASYEILRVFRRFMAKKYYHDELVGDYVFLPFQVMYDFHLPLYWAEYTNLEYLVEVCRKGLPPGFKLVVKEHPHLRGGIPVAVLRRISRMKDVVLVPVDMNPQLLLDGCKAVVVLCSSVGWQAMMHHKPVVMINSKSNPEYQYYYATYGVTINVDGDDMGEGIRRSLHEPVDQDRVDSFLYHVIMARYAGSDVLCPVEYTRMTEDGNLGIVSRYLYEKIKKELVV